MAIHKKATHLTIEIKKEYRSKAQQFCETAKKVEIIARKDNLKLSSKIKVEIKGKK